MGITRLTTSLTVLSEPASFVTTASFSILCKSITAVIKLYRMRKKAVVIEKDIVQREQVVMWLNL